MGLSHQTARPAARQSWCLCFEEADVETQYINDHSARVRAHDQQAAAVYLSMVASGSVLYLIISAFIPAAKAGRVDCCLSLIICSWIGPAVHLLLLLLLPNLVYERHRTKITLALRLFYLLATSINGFGVCGVGPISPTVAGAAAQLAAAPAVTSQQESTMSAFFWRSGIIGLVWYSGAFPLLFWQHCLVQTGFLLIYHRTLSPLVCSSIQRVNHGPQVIAAVFAAANGFWAQLLAANGAVSEAARHTAAAAAAAAAAAMPSPGAATAGGIGNVAVGVFGSFSSSIGSQFGSYSSCMRGLTFLQLLLGHALPTFLLYCSEARSRQQWLAAQRRRRSSTASSSASDSNGQLHDLASSSLYGSIEQAAAAAICAENAAQLASAAASSQQQPGNNSGQAEWANAGDCSNACAANCCSESCQFVKNGAQQIGMLADGSSSRHACNDAATGGAAATAAAAGTGRGTAAGVVSSDKLSKLVRRFSFRSKGSAGKNGQGSNSSSGASAPWLLDLPQLDSFEKECQAAALPPSFREVFVLIASLGLAWMGLEHLV